MFELKKRICCCAKGLLGILWWRGLSTKSEFIVAMGKATSWSESVSEMLWLKISFDTFL